MKKAVFALALVGILSSASFANGFRLGTVDMQKVLQSVAAGKKAKKQLENFFNTKKEKLKKEEASLKKMAEEFKKQSLVLNDSARAKKQSEIQEHYVKLQQLQAKAREEVAKKEQELTAPLIANIRKLIKTTAKEKKYQVILEKNENNVLYSSEQDDLTGELIKKYNEKHKA